MTPRTTDIQISAPRTTVDTQIIADQERAIARLKAELELAESRERELEQLAVDRFNPPDDDATTIESMLEVAADALEASPCSCPPGAADREADPCQRCVALGRVADEAIAR